MRRKLNTAFVLAIIASLLLYKGMMIPAMIFVILAGFKFLSWLRDPIRPVINMMKSDAKNHGCRVISHPKVLNQLTKIYARFKRQTELYPALSESYHEIINGMWMELSKATDLSTWLKILQKVSDEWPMSDDESPLECSLKNGRSTTHRWREAQREVYSPY